ncbi:uracil-DNA glycosylase [Massilia sp. W12]|uniref:uracil-DNA glycosylase n=1 Tax=Massilia sp. W12 TaxID=3126507 RepID=UPI0030D586D0
MTKNFAPEIERALALADPSWHDILRHALHALDTAFPDYLPQLLSSAFLPTQDRLFAAFTQPLENVRWILVGEGPYPRAASATGYCFMDGAVGSLWQQGGGLSKAVNRATSLRNLMKMLLVAGGALQADQLNPHNMAAISARACAPGSGMTQTLAAFQERMHACGFLLLNASLVFREEVAPALEARPWQVFFLQLLQDLHAACAQRGQALPCLILWGKIAARLQALPQVQAFPQRQAEHPYNLSFIQNRDMQQLFAPFNLLGLPTGNQAPLTKT